MRYKGYETRICVVDPPESVFFGQWQTVHDHALTPSTRAPMPSRIEGIGRPALTKSFLPEVIDSVLRVPANASVAAMLYLYETGRYYTGPSTGTNFCGIVSLLVQMQERGEQGSLVTLLCDSGFTLRKDLLQPPMVDTATLPGWHIGL